MISRRNLNVFAKVMVQVTTSSCHEKKIPIPVYDDITRSGMIKNDVEINTTFAIRSQTKFCIDTSK